MRVAWPIAVVVIGCGRIHFDPASDSGGTVADARPADQIADLVVWYPFDESSFPGIAREVVRGLDATCSVCAASTTGTIGGAAAFNAMEYFVIPHDPVLDTTSGFTLALWFRPDMFTTFNHVLSRQLGTADNNTWQIELPNVLMTRLKLATGPTTSQSYLGPAALGVWVHVAGTWDGTTARLYQDGSMVDMGPQATIPFDQTEMYIAADDNGIGPAPRFIGAIDDIRIYSRALTPGEVALLATP